MILAGDVGGTKTLLGLFEPDRPRPRALDVREFSTQAFDGLLPMVDVFLQSSREGARVTAASVGVAGPVRNQAAELTNVSWRVSAADLSAHLGGVPVRLLNDVEAMAHGLGAIAPGEMVVLQPGTPEPEGNLALVTVGTGLGQALVQRVDGRPVPLASEGGHSDFPARTDREIAVLRALRERFGRVDIERVVSGPGLANVARVLHGGPCPEAPPDLDPADEPAHVSQAALEGRCARCREALDLVVEALGAVAGNLALTGLATGGVYIGGGIPRRILPALVEGPLLAAFRAKQPLDGLMAAVPVSVITNLRAGLLGAAVAASALG